MAGSTANSTSPFSSSPNTTIQPLAPGGDPNNLTGFTNSLSNLAAGQGQANSNTGITDVSSAGTGLQKVIDYYSKLMGGNRSEISSAVGTEVDTIGSQFDNIRKMLSQGGARGGGTASALATLPQQQTSQVTNLINQARSGAAGGLQGASSALGGLGTAEQQIGLGGEDLSLKGNLAEQGFGVTERGQDAGVWSNVIGALI